VPSKKKSLDTLRNNFNDQWANAFVCKEELLTWAAQRTGKDNNSMARRIEKLHKQQPY
jgi:hypothetical protein